MAMSVVRKMKKFKYCDVLGRNIEQASEAIFRAGRTVVYVPDNKAIGETMRETRKRRGTSLRNLALRMKLSAPYVSDLELGRRGWTQQRVLDYMKALHE